MQALERTFLRQIRRFGLNKLRRILEALAIGTVSHTYMKSENAQCAVRLFIPL